MKNVSDRLIGRLGMAEERISELEDMYMKISQMEMQKEQQLWKKKKTKENIQEQGNNCKRFNTSIMGIPDKERKEKKYLN